jgi:hypothetical protein
MDASLGNIKGIFTVFNPAGSYTSTVANGIDDKIPAALLAAQRFAVTSTTAGYAPIFVIVEGYNYSGVPADLADFNLLSYDRVGLIIGDTETRAGSTASLGAAIGLLAGRLAKSQVQVNCGKVKDGPVNAIKMFIVNNSVESANVTTIHNKGIITFRHHVGKSGYFFTDDPLATAATSDYKSLARRRVIDKAYRLAYSVAVEEINNDVDVLANGTLSPITAKEIEGRCANTIFNAMTANGELSVDPANPNDKGCIVEIDLTHNVTSTSKLKFKRFQVKAKGYTKFIDVPLGFVPVTSI